jgi:hypothetical protein
LEAIMFNSFSSTIGGAQEQGSAEDLWDLVFYGIGTGPAS